MQGEYGICSDNCPLSLSVFVSHTINNSWAGLGYKIKVSILQARSNDNTETDNTPWPSSCINWYSDDKSIKIATNTTGFFSGPSPSRSSCNRQHYRKPLYSHGCIWKIYIFFSPYTNWCFFWELESDSIIFFLLKNNCYALPLIYIESSTVRQPEVRDIDENISMRLEPRSPGAQDPGHQDWELTWRSPCPLSGSHRPVHRTVWSHCLRSLQKDRRDKGPTAVRLYCNSP